MMKRITQANCFLFIIILLLECSTGYYTATLSQPQVNLAASYDNNGLALFAGGNLPSGSYTRTVDNIFNFSSGEHRTANLSIPHAYLTAVQLREEVLFAGCIITGTTVTNVVDIYNAATDACVKL